MALGKRSLVGLSINPDYVRVAAVRIIRGKPVVIRGGVEPTPPEAYREGRIAEPEAVARVLRQLWRRQGMPGKQAVVGLGGPNVLFRLLNLPHMPTRELRNAVHWELDSHFPLDPREAVFDCLEVRTLNVGEGNRVEVLVVAAPLVLAQSYAETLERARIRARVLEPEPLAVLRVFQLEEPQQVVLLVAGGTSHSSVLILRGSELLFARVAPWGTRDLEGAIGPQLEAARRELLRECTRSLEYYQVQTPGRVEMPERVMLAGEVLQTHPHLLVYLGEELGMPAAEMPSMLGWETTVAPEARALVSVCAGLALREVRGYGRY